MAGPGGAFVGVAGSGPLPSPHPQHHTQGPASQSSSGKLPMLSGQSAPQQPGGGGAGGGGGGAAAAGGLVRLHSGSVASGDLASAMAEQQLRQLQVSVSQGRGSASSIGAGSGGQDAAAAAASAAAAAELMAGGLSDGAGSQVRK